MFAHSLRLRPVLEWEPLGEHHRRVADRASAFAEVFGWAALAKAAGALHDIGKCSAAFQSYIAQVGDEIHRRGPNHSSAGAREVTRLYGGDFGTLLALTIAGHHAGLPDGVELANRLARDIPPYDGWQAHTGPLPALAALAPTQRPAVVDLGFYRAFLTRMVFSCLADADRLETAGFYARADGGPSGETRPTPLPVLRDRLREHMARTGRESAAKAAIDTQRRLAALRAEVLDHAVAQASLKPGLFTLTVPTGGGKTLASLSFALEHAVLHGLRRVVYVIPFTSIIEQTAAVFRAALGGDADTPNTSDILEHHASFDWDGVARAAAGAGEDGSGTSGVEQLQRAAENWDAPIVVTTAVQFFESLFANRPSTCRKLHNLAGSVIVLDEAQTLPLRVLRPSLAALDELARNYGASIVLCTATQPAWRKQDEALMGRGGARAAASFGLDIAAERELAPEPARLFSALKRVEIAHLRETIGDDTIAARFAEQPQMLCIVNSRRHAKLLFDAIAHLPGAIHLSTWMCPRHRRNVLDQARADLKAGKPVRIVSTSLIEAGVDIDLPEVWRAAAGIDSILQAAGRCNREFRLAAGRLVIFTPEGDEGPHELRQAWQAGRSTLRRHDDPQTPEAITDYFRELYLTKGDAAFDACRIDGEVWPIMPAIRERRDSGLFPFGSIARAFRLIVDEMEPVVVPWSSGPDDDDADAVLGRIAAMERPARADLRRLQLYTVTIPKPQRDAWLAQGVLRAVHPALGEAMLRFDDLSLYDAHSGVKVLEPTLRRPESNVFGS